MYTAMRGYPQSETDDAKDVVNTRWQTKQIKLSTIEDLYVYIKIATYAPPNYEYVTEAEKKNVSASLPRCSPGARQVRANEP